MKRMAGAAAAAALVLVLLGCYWTTGTGAGQLSLQFSGVTPKGLGDYYGRVYLLANGARFALRPDAEYVEVPLSQYEPTTVVVDGVPAGPVYTALVSVVRQEEQGYYTEQWAQSAPFAITPGRIVSVPLELQWAEFYPVWGMMGKDIKDVAAEGSTIYAADAARVYPGNVEEGVNVEPEGFAVPAGQTINSLTMGKNFASEDSQLWANTDRAILPFHGEGFGDALTVNLGTVSVLDSAWGRAESGSDFVLYFRRAEGLGGTYILGNQPYPPQWSWVNVASDRVLDLCAGEGGQGLFATSGGAFRLAQAFLQDSTPSIGEHRLPLPAPAPVRALVALAGDGEHLYLGTENGGWGDNAWDEYPLLQATGTGGFPIRRVAVFESSPRYQAYLSDAYVFVVDDEWPEPTLIFKLPFVAGFPGKVNGMAWASSGASVYLLLATDQGLAHKWFERPW